MYLPSLISSNLIPLHLLPRDGQLPPQSLKRILTQPLKTPIQLFLIPPFNLRNALYNLRGRGRGAEGGGNGPFGEQADIAVFVVVHVDFD